jgi:uncharacterized protein (TIGR03437 family)
MPGSLLRLAAAVLLCFSALAQAPPTLAVDAAANRHPISPDIYGINQYTSPPPALMAQMRVSVRRFGGDATTRYNWKLDNYNSGSDWYFENSSYNAAPPAELPDNSYFDQMVAANHTTHTKTLGTIPIIGWTTNGPGFACSFSVAKYGPQDKTDPYNPDCGNGQHNGKWLTGTDPHDTSVPVGQAYYSPWIAHLMSTFGPANQGGVNIWSLDNEPEWWMDVHHDVHPSPSTYDEVWQKDMTFAQMIKAADPSALTSGPVPSGWDAYFYSALDFVNGWSTAPYQYNDNPVDRDAHGGLAWLDWYLQQMHNYDLQHNQRLLDYLDLHAYIAPEGVSFGQAGDAAANQLRLTSTRAFWDPNYLVPNVDPTTPIRLIPRMHDWVDNDYPGTKLAITEYNWGALDDITGALAEADILGIFGREGLDLGTLWGPPAAGQPGVFAFEIFNNYDGAGGAFGDTSVSATSSNPDVLSIFAAQRSDLALTILVINKTTSPITAPIPIANFPGAGLAHVYQYSAADLTRILPLPDVNLSGETIPGALPAYSMTLFVLPAAASQFTVPAPVVNAVVNAASYTSGIAPGEMVTLFGSGLGPVTPQPLALDANGLLSTQVAGTRILFDGIPAPLIYVSSTQAAAMAPYFIANLQTVHVQVEYLSHRSAALVAPVVAASPGLFTRNQQGAGQASALNQDGHTANSAATPAPAGSIVSLFLTGEGQTSPPGYDGKLAASILPTPVLPVSVTIGGLPAHVDYAGAAPGMVAGIMQVNARIPSAVTPGPAVGVTVTVGTAATSGNVTLAVSAP